MSCIKSMRNTDFILQLSHFQDFLLLKGGLELICFLPTMSYPHFCLFPLSHFHDLNLFLHSIFLSFILVVTLGRIHKNEQLLD